MDAAAKAQQRALEEAVARTLRDNLASLQRTSDDLQHACTDFIAACSSTRPTNALPAMLRAQTAAMSLASSLSVLVNFITSALHPRGAGGAMVLPGFALLETPAEEIAAEEAESAAPDSSEAADLGRKTAGHAKGRHAKFEAPTFEAPDKAPSGPPSRPPVDAAPSAAPHIEYTETIGDSPHTPGGQGRTESATIPPWEAMEEAAGSSAESASSFLAESIPPVESVEEFDVSRLPSEQQDLHRRANRVAKVTMQDIQLLKPDQVQLGRQNKDLCLRLRHELDRARKEYDRRFQTILEHPVDYFHHWMVEILGNGDPASLGEYPYKSAPLRH